MAQDKKVTANRTYKSSVFTMVFQEKKELLELYNAVSGKHYEDPEELEINTLDNAIYMSIKNDLSFIKKLLQQLGNPQDQVKTIHITGTNGKGSTSYYLANLLKKAGQKTGLFVSPYVYQFNERIQLNNQDISDEDLVNVANKVQAAFEEIKQEDKEFSLVTFE